MPFPGSSRPRPLALAGVAALAGALAGSWCRADARTIGLLVGATIAAAVAAGLLLRRRFPTEGRRALPFMLAAAALGPFLAAARLGLQEVALADGVMRARAPPIADTTLRVRRCGQDPFANRAWLVGAPPEGAGLLCSWPGRLPDDIGAGAVVRVAGRVRLPQPPTNPGEADQAARLARDGIAARVYAGEPGNVEVLEAGGSRLDLLLRRTRRAGAERLRDALPAADAGIAAALVFGWRSGIAEGDRLLFERTGTLHLLAISGLHLLLVAAGVHAACRRLGLGPRGAAAATLAVCVLYVPVAGAGAPVRRAATVLVVYGIALARGRLPDAAGALGGAALLLVLQDPDEVRSVGFWLSFAAAAGIALHARAWRDRWSARHRLLARFPAVQQDRRWRLRGERYVLSSVPVSLAAWGATAPLVAWRFGLVTPWAPLTNLVAAPLVTLLMPCSFAVACGLEPLAPVVRVLCAVLRWALQRGDALPFACLAVAPPAPAALAVWYGGYVLLRVRPRVGLGLLGTALLVAWPPRDHTAPTMTVLDVGHGQAVLLVDRRGRAALIDAGSRNRLDLGRRVLQPALRSAAVARLDLAVCTHADRDHWSGIAELVGRVPLARLAVGPRAPPGLTRAARRAGASVWHPRTREMLWDADGIVVRVLDDGRDRPDASDNDRSLVLLVEFGRHRVLLPADREELGVRALLRTGVPPCEILFAPHHGARNPALEGLVKGTGARTLLVSTGPGFADDASLAALPALRVLRTDRDGALRVEPGPRGELRVTATRAHGDTIRPP